jgi:electron transfer flavoprotein alpha subunit
MSQDVVVFVEVQNGQIRKVTPQLISAARRLAEGRGGAVHALLLGHDLGGLPGEAAFLGVDQLFVLDHPSLKDYTSEAYVAVLAAALQELKAGVLVAGNTAIGRDTGPRIAERLGWAMVSDVVEVISSEGNPVLKRPVYAGKALCHVEVLDPNFVVSIRANSFPSAGPTESPAVVNHLPASLAPSQIRTEFNELLKREVGKVDLTEADIIVSGGMGVKGPEGFEFLKPLADTLGAAIGSSRAAVLAGYIHPSHQVGQTGKTVSPSLYIACGISGAIQHRAGMSTSKCIVAINTDPEAPMFEIADYGIVGDLFKVVPCLTEEFKKLLGK